MRRAQTVRRMLTSRARAFLAERPFAVAVAIIACGVSVAAVAGLYSEWDGGYYLFRTLDRQELFVANRRFIDLPLQLPVLVASQLTGDGRVLETIFGLSFGAVPLVVIVACARVVGWRSPRLVWPALGIGFGTVVGQANATSEAMMAVQLFWPALLAVLDGRPLRRSALAVVLAGISVVAHPFAIATLAACAAVAVIRRDRRWGVVLGLLAIAAVARLFVYSLPYETQQITGGGVGDSTIQAFAGVHGLAFVLAVVAAAALLGRMRPIAIVAGVAAAALFIAWAAGPRSLPESLYLRLSLPVIVAPFALAALLDRRPTARDGARSAMIVLSGATLAAVLCVQSVHWSSYRDALRTGLAANADTCVPYGRLPFTPGLDSNFWSVPAYSLVIQGRSPTHVAEPDTVCAARALRESVPVTDRSEVRPYGTGWFHLAALRPD